MVPAERPSGNRPETERIRCDGRITSRMRIRNVAPCALLLLLVAPAARAPRRRATERQTDAPAPPSPSAPSGTAEPDPVAEDLEGLLAVLDRTHPNAWHGIERDDFVAAIEAYRVALPAFHAGRGGR